MELIPSPDRARRALLLLGLAGAGCLLTACGGGATSVEVWVYGPELPQPVTALRVEIDGDPVESRTERLLTPRPPATQVAFPAHFRLDFLSGRSGQISLCVSAVAASGAILDRRCVEKTIEHGRTVHVDLQLGLPDGGGADGGGAPVDSPPEAAQDGVDPCSVHLGVPCTRGGITICCEFPEVCGGPVAGPPCCSTCYRSGCAAGARDEGCGGLCDEKNAGDPCTDSPGPGTCALRYGTGEKECCPSPRLCVASNPAPAIEYNCAPPDMRACACPGAAGVGACGCNCSTQTASGACACP